MIIIDGGRYTRSGDKNGSAWFVSERGFEIFRWATARGPDGQPSTWQWCLGQPNAKTLYAQAGRMMTIVVVIICVHHSLTGNYCSAQ